MIAKCHSYRLLCGLMLSLLACTPRAYLAPESAPFQSTNTDPERLSESLFDAKESTISEEGIARILDGYIVLPDSARVALLNLESKTLRRYYPSYWSDENYRLLQQGFIDTLISNLDRTGRVQRVSLLPQLLLSNEPTIFSLRESAVRMQTDLLFVFSIYSTTYNRVRVFNKDETKAYATCEGLLLDIRTGIVPFTTVVSRDYVATNTATDANAGDRSRRAETEASRQALAEVADRLRLFLTGAD
jgi:hypothetical protein